MSRSAIWKFPLAAVDYQLITMPAGAEIVCVQVQRGTACLWAKVNPDAPTDERGFWMHGTGHDISHDRLGRYVGTFQIAAGALVFHVFEEAK